MDDDRASMAEFMARFRQHPLIRTLEERFEFTAVATVETRRADFYEARAWALAREPVRQIQGKVCPHRLHPESNHVIWEFELEGDAILFACKFGGVIASSETLRNCREGT